MIVVSDTSPLNYLIQITLDHVLPSLFGEILVPPEVLQELNQPQTPESVRSWILSPPSWLKIESPKIQIESLELDLGETAAIALALERNADSILIDDRKARIKAQGLGLFSVGTLMVLEIAAERKLINLPVAVDKLRQTNFRISEILIQDALSRDQIRKQS